MLPIALLSKKNLASRLAFRHFQELCKVAWVLARSSLMATPAWLSGFTQPVPENAATPGRPHS
jgi:hypothetical protein